MKNYIFDLYETVIVDTGDFYGESAVVRDVVTKDGNTLYGLKLKDVDALLYFLPTELNK